MNLKKAVGLLTQLREIRKNKAIYNKEFIMIEYFYPELDPKNPKSKKFVNELLNPQEAYMEAQRKAASMKKPKNDIMQKEDQKLLTNDGREMLNENF
jgi:hypothetical protein